MRGTAGSIDTDTRGLNVYYRRIKPPIDKTIGKTFKRENGNVLRGLFSSRFQDGGPATYCWISCSLHQTSGFLAIRPRCILGPCVFRDPPSCSLLELYVFCAE